jgi:hypothetical protein
MDFSQMDELADFLRKKHQLIEFEVEFSWINLLQIGELENLGWQ